MSNQENPRGPLDIPSMPPPPPPPGFGVYPPPPPPRHSLLGRILTGVISTVLITSLMFNLYFISVVAAESSGPTESTYVEGDSTNRIVILPITGTIDDSTASFVRQAVGVFKKNKPKAIILRVNSPGGGVSAADLIWHELTEFKKDNPGIPIVASYGSIAASGGVYVSALSDYIFAEPTSLTGSIGVIAESFTFQELMQKVGVTPEIVHSTHAIHKDMLNPFRAWTDSDRDALRTILDQAHGRFVHIVADGRKAKLTEEQVATLATGEVFTVKAAITNGLVDEEGYLEAAIEKARTLAKLPAGVEVTKIEPAKSFSILGALGTTSVPAQTQTPVTGEQLRQWMTELSTPRVEYRMAPLR